jgi:hypothetical protein
MAYVTKNKARLYIRGRANALNLAIERLEKERSALREECPHKVTAQVNYSWGPGRIAPDSTVCVDCDELIKLGI